MIIPLTLGDFKKSLDEMKMPDDTTFEVVLFYPEDDAAKRYVLGATTYSLIGKPKVGFLVVMEDEG